MCKSIDWFLYEGNTGTEWEVIQEGEGVIWKGGTNTLLELCNACYSNIDNSNKLYINVYGNWSVVERTSKHKKTRKHKILSSMSPKPVTMPTISPKSCIER